MILGQGSLAKKFALRFKVGRKQQPLTDMVAAAIVEHIRLCN